MRTALHLRQYEDILSPLDVYSFLALASFYNKFFGQCSKVCGAAGRGSAQHGARSPAE